MSIASGSIVQVAWVVTDLDAAETMFTGQFATGPWTRLEAVHFAPDSCTYRGRPADFTADVSLAYSGDLQLELIRPLSGDSIYTEFLSVSGPGRAAGAPYLELARLGPEIRAFFQTVKGG